MTGLPRLRVVPLEIIRRHEEIDPLRVERLSERIGSDGIQVNPMVCIEAPGGNLVLLDGATRTESLKKIDLTHAVVQVVDPETVTLDTWHHVVRGCTVDDLLAALSAAEHLRLVEETGAPSVLVRGRSPRHVLATDLTSNATLSALVGRYMGRWNVTRTTDPRPEPAEANYPDWAGIVEFPTLTIEDVMAAAVGEDLLPAGITRFKVPERALRLNIPLAMLAPDRPVDDMQADLDSVMEERAREGRIRRYEEPVFILDD